MPEKLAPRRLTFRSTSYGCSAKNTFSCTGPCVSGKTIKRAENVFAGMVTSTMRLSYQLDCDCETDRHSLRHYGWNDSTGSTDGPGVDPWEASTVNSFQSAEAKQSESRWS